MDYLKELKTIKKVMKLTNEQLSEKIGISLSSMKRFMGCGDGKGISDSIVSTIHNFVDRNYFEDSLLEVIKTKAKNQRMQDENTLLKQQQRTYSRTANVYHYIEEVIANMPKIEIDNTPFEYKENSCEMIVQLSDLHIGKMFSNFNNSYNYEIAKKRLDKYCESVLLCAYNNGANKVIIVNTGDNINLDHRLDQLKESEFVRGEALVKAYELIVNFIKRLSESVDITYCSVVGNESRFDGKEFHTNSEDRIKDNFDYVLHKMIQATCNIPIIGDCDKFYQILNIKSKNIAVFHGDKIEQKNLTSNLLNLKTRILEEQGILIDYFIFGHIHETLISNNFARSASIVGSDSYSSTGLNIANNDISQLIHVVKDDSIQTIRIELKGE